MKYGTFLRDQYLDKALELRRQGYSCEKIGKIFSLGHDTVRKWCVKFAPELVGNLSMRQKDNVTPPMPEKQTDSDTVALRQRIKELEAQLKKESIRADFYDEMINVAEAKFNIPIRKKAGTKQ